MVPVSAPEVRLLCLAVGSFGLAYGFGALTVALGPGAYTTYAAHQPIAATTAGLVLVLAAMTAIGGGGEHRVAALAILAAVCWSAPVWVGWSDGPGLVRGLGALASPFLVPVAAQWVVGSMRERGTAAARGVVATAYAAAALTAVGRALFRDPLDDPSCWDNCVVNVFLVQSRPGLVHDLDWVARWLQVGVGAALLVLSLRGWWSGTAAARRLEWPVRAGGLVTGSSVVAHALLTAARPEHPADPALRATFLALAGGMALLALGPLLAWFRGLAQRRQMGRIAVELGAGPPPGALESALGRAVGDPGLSIAYWMPSGGRFVDGHGRTANAPVAGADARLTTLVRDGRPIATIRHATSVAGAMQGLGVGTEVALDNARLRAALLSQADDIRASRERIIEAADAGRHRLERDLHDGAQQRLLALSYHLRLALAAADAEHDGEAADLLANAVDESMQALQELRALAHGIYPAILAEAGLGSALADLSDTAVVPVSVACAVEGRVGLPVESAAYVVVREALEDAVSRAATTVDVRVARDEDRVVIVIDDDGVIRTSDLLAVTDRVGALGGTLRLEPRTLRAELPCG